MTDLYRPEEGDEDYDEIPTTLTLQVKAFLTLNLYVQGAQRNMARTILVTDSSSETSAEGPTEVFKGHDGETGDEVQVRVTYPWPSATGQDDD